MMSKAWYKGPLRYLLMRAQLGWEETVAHLSGASVSDAIAKGYSVFQRDLTRTIFFTGAAMLPTLACKVSSQQNAVDTLLMRCMPRPSLRTIFSGDVIAFNSPLAPASDSSIMVRRVAAVEGEELITDDPSDSSFTIPEAGKCWVLADNEELKPPEVIDSRSFGPLPVENILGRIIYYVRPNDHGMVENSKAAMAADAAVLEAELDLNKLQQS